MTDITDVIVDPVGVIVRLVGEVEQHLSPEQVRDVVCGVVRARAGRRRLAEALHKDPSLLRTGRPPAPYSLAKLLMALGHAGAQNISRPRCGACGREHNWVGSRRGGQWSCSTCMDKPAVCAGCGELRRVTSRDRRSEPRCADCPDIAGNPMAELIDLAVGLDPALSPEVVTAALNSATVRPAGQRRLAWDVIAQPDLLTGAGCDARAPAVLRFIDELVVAGATAVVRPACPRCGQVKALSNRRGQPAGGTARPALARRENHFRPTAFADRAGLPAPLPEPPLSPLSGLRRSAAAAAIAAAVAAPNCWTVCAAPRYRPVGSASPLWRR